MNHESAGHSCPKCDSVMYFAAGKYRCGGRCGFVTSSADRRMWNIIVNLQRVLHAVEGMLTTLPAMEKKREGAATDFYEEVLKDTCFKRANIGALDER